MAHDACGNREKPNCRLYRTFHTSSIPVASTIRSSDRLLRIEVVDQLLCHLLTKGLLTKGATRRRGVGVGIYHKRKLH